MLNNWLETLLSFDFSIVHKPGILNILPDRISRFYDADPVEETIEDPRIWNDSHSTDSPTSLHSLVFDPAIVTPAEEIELI
jgi:hypothetical protein